MTTGTLVRPNQAGLYILVALCFLLQSTSGQMGTADCSVREPDSPLPVLRLLYAVDNSTNCIDPASQNGTILAIVECSYYNAPSRPLHIVSDPSNGDGTVLYEIERHLVINGSSVTGLYYVILSSRQDNRIHRNTKLQITCFGCDDVSYTRFTAVNLRFCTKDSDTAMPHFVVVPRLWDVQVPVNSMDAQHGSSRSPHIPLFNVITEVFPSEVSVTCICSIMVNNISNQQGVFNIPFYIGEGYLYFNVSAARDDGPNITYPVVISANGTEPGMVGMVLTVVSVTKTEVNESISSLRRRLNPPTLEVNHTFSCPYAESQPGQLLAIIKCFDKDNPTETAPTVSPLMVCRQVQYIGRNVFWPTTDVNVSLQRDHGNDTLTYLTLEHVNNFYPLDETQQNSAPTYRVYVQCINNISMVVYSKPVTFCIKHDRITTEYNANAQRFTYETATPYFTNIPREMHLSTDPQTQCNTSLFNPAINVFYTAVKSYTHVVEGDYMPVRGVCQHETVLTAHETDLDLQVYSPSESTPFTTAWEQIYTCEDQICKTRPPEFPNCVPVPPTDYITLLYATVSTVPLLNKVNLPVTYDLVVHASSKSKTYIGRADVLITVHLHQGDATSNKASALLNCSSTLNLGISLNLLPEAALTQTLHIKASNGTLLGAFYCSDTTGLKSPITVSRVRTVTSEDSANDIISFNIIKDHSNSGIYYWILQEALVTAKQYFLISCSNAFSVYSERVSISVETEPSAASTPQPSFKAIKQQCTVDVQGVEEDKAIFEFVVKVPQSGGGLSATSDVSLEVVSVSTFDLPFYIRLNSVLMLNVSNLQDVGKEAVYDLIVTARVNNSTGRAYTRITLTNATANGTNETLAVTEDDTARIIALSVTLPLLGGLLLAFIVLFARLEVRRRRRKHRHSLQTIRMRRLSGVELLNLKSLQLDVGKEWITEWDHVQVGRVLGEGQFGEVHRGMITWQGVPPARKNQYEENSLIPVAIKSIKGTISSSDKQAFEDEINLMVKVSGGNNPHIIKLIGCVTEQFPPAILLEFALYGNLCDYLRSCRPAETDAKQSPDGAKYDSLHPFVPSDLISFTQQIASGMEYLAALGVIHRDLACRNVLVGEGKVLKIADFGLSRHTDLYVSTLSTKLPIRWMAPESIKDRVFSEKSDVWAYGVTIWEICTLGGFPYYDLSNEVLVHRILGGYQMKRPTNCSDEIYELMESCWRLSPDDRPTFSEINGKLCGLVEQSSSHDYISMLEPSEVPTDSVDTLDTEGTETVEEVAVAVRT